MNGIIIAVLCAVLVLWYLASCFTSVQEGTVKIVVRFDGYVKTLLCKQGYKIDENGEVVQLRENESPQYPDFLGGIRWVSLLKPLGIDRILVRTMKFVKALSNGEFQSRTDEGTDFMLAGVHYQYGLSFDSAEDSEKLPLSGKMTMTTMITNPYKAMFRVKDWFDALVSRVLPCVREYISEHSYDEIIGDRDVKLDQDVFEALNQVGGNGEPSIISILKNEYGIVLVALETVNIDPPEGYRETTLAKWKAEQIAQKEAEETAGRILRAVAIEAGIEVGFLRARLDADPSLRGKSAKDGGFREAFDYAKDLVKRDRAGGGLTDVRIGNADGTKLDPATATIASLIGLLGNSGGKGNNPRKKGKPKDPKDMDDDELFSDLPGADE